MKETLLTRTDDHVGDGPFDSIKWAFEEHVKQPDDDTINSAVLYGNEDSPEFIDFYHEAAPLVTSRKVWRWKQDV